MEMMGCVVHKFGVSILGEREDNPCGGRLYASEGQRALPICSLHAFVMWLLLFPPCTNCRTLF